MATSPFDLRFPTSGAPGGRDPGRPVSDRRGTRPRPCGGIGSRAPILPARLGIVLLLGWIAAAPLSADGGSLGFFEARRLERDAQAALLAGNGAAASEVYGRLIEGLGTGKKRHGRALYGAAVAELQKPTEQRDPELARLWLDRFLADYPAHPDRAAARSLRNALDLETPAPPPPPSVEPAPAAPEDPAPNPRVEVLESRIERLKAELATTREELAKKEEALRKLKEAVVGGDG